MNVAQIENHLKLLVYTLDKETFIYNLLESYYLPKASISRLQKGNLNLSKVPGEVSWKKKLFFKEELNKDLHLTISALKNEIKHNQRFIIVTDYETLLAVDTVTQDQLDIPIKELPKYYDFFLPWAGMEKATHAAENPADVKAAEKMAKLFDEIKKDNPDTSAEFNHNLNIFFSRLLFCYFAEDTNIFEDNQFSHAVESHTRGDGSDLDAYLNRLFWVLNTPVDKRGEIPHYLNAFPYVNGGLFKEEISCPKFTSKSRQLLIDSGDSNDWSAINPDIFGSMFQAVISPEHRGGLGAHYTSVPNIMKVIEPLFLNDLKEEFENASGNEKKLRELLHRISKIKLFDPACGSGNFLIIAYKELRRLEMLILKELGGFAFSGIHLNNFYGIELDDFAHEIAKLSLWLAEHQMNVEFFNEFGRTNPTLPLQEAGQIVCGNACRLDWEKVCPKNEGDEIYILGNPPYIGRRNQNKIQKQEIIDVLGNLKNHKSLDYICIWFFKGCKYITSIKNSKIAVSFVSTNSICQGELVSIFWPNILKNNISIIFAHKSFKWVNNAKSNAGVSVVIIGISNISPKNKMIFSHGLSYTATHINAYLVDSKDNYVQNRTIPISYLPEMSYGNLPGGCTELFLNREEKLNLSKKYPQLIPFIKRLIGADESINGIEKYCLWFKGLELTNSIFSIPEISNKINSVRENRASSKDESYNSLANRPHEFRDLNETKNHSILIPIVSSERRQYVPISIVNNDAIVPNSAQVIYDSSFEVFSIINSRMHMLWLENIGGKLETRYRYSKNLVYNTFPFPIINLAKREDLTQCTFRILEEREKHPEKTLAELYDPDKMPGGLKEVHRLNDEAVERCYRINPFNSDEERLEYLFKLYEKMIQEEKEKGTLFEAEKKSRKKK
jgi:type I restriction-modification system DNA methylase subunit